MRQQPERELLASIDNIMGWEGWRIWKLETVRDKERGRGFGEPGMADRLYLRPTGKRGASFACEALYVEGKRVRSDRPSATKAQAHQQLWHAAERASGFRTVILGQDCEATFDGFFRWYGEAGLFRRMDLERVKLWQPKGK